MNAFVDNKHLVSWAGLSPRCSEAARKKKTVKITKAGVYIKARYESLKRRRGHKKAIIAITRLLLTSIYHILNTGEVFDYNRFENLLN